MPHSLQVTKKEGNRKRPSLDPPCSGMRAMHHPEQGVEVDDSNRLTVRIGIVLHIVVSR